MISYKFLAIFGLILVSMTVSQTDDSLACAGVTSPSKDNCHAKSKTDGIYCCYVDVETTLSGKTTETKSCAPLENLDKYEDSMDLMKKASSGDASITINDFDCSSNFLSFSAMIALIYTFLF